MKRSLIGLLTLLTLFSCSRPVTVRSDNNNATWDKLAKTPNPELKKLERLIGRWKISGQGVTGHTSYEWMEGGFFLVQHFDLDYYGEKHKGVEYTGFDEQTKTLRSRLIKINGANLIYTYDIQGNTLWYWFGEKGSDNFSKGTFSSDNNTLSGRWQWPEHNGKTGGYEYTITRVQ